MNKLQPYDEYKDSGIEWLGEIPAHWEVMRMKDIVYKISSGVTPSGGSEVYQNSGIPFLRSQNVYDNGLRLENVAYISEEINQKMKSSEIRPKDVLINITGASITRTCIVPKSLKKGNINQHIALMRGRGDIVFFISSFLKSQAIKDYIMREQLGASKEAFNLSQIATTPLAIPPTKEQTHIAAYLDRQTALIDQKISLLQQKVDKYQELKKSLINEAVCRGLDKNVPMKDSGVEWIGEVPGHWEVRRVKDVAFKIGSGVTPSGGSEVYQKSGIPFLRSQNVYDDGLSMENVAHISEEINDKMKSSQIRSNDILINITGASIARTCLVPASLKKANVNQHVAFIRGRNGMVFASLFLKTQLIKDYIMREQIGASKEAFNLSQIANTPLLVPPSEEQDHIADYLNRKTSQISDVIANIQRQIEVLHELRKTLINDVVTDKVRVICNLSKSIR